MNFLRRIFSAVFGVYEGAKYTFRRSRLDQSLQSSRFDIDQMTREELSRKMRYFEANNPIVSALAGKFENFVVGANPQLTPASEDPEWNGRAKPVWDIWSRNCDTASRQHLSTILSLAARSWFIDGEAFIILTEGKEVRAADGSIVRRPRIQLVESHLCKTPPDLAKDPNVVDGIRLDSNGRPVAYYFAEETEPGKYKFGPPRDARFVIHIFEPSRIGQVRGLTFFHSVLNQLHDLDDLQIMEMTAAKANSERVYEIQTQSGELKIPDAIRSRVTRNVTNGNGDTSVETINQFYKEALPNGRVVVTRRGDKINQHAGERPSVVTQGYWQYLTELVCTGVEIPYCIAFPGSMQGTVYRGALEMATAFFRSRHLVIAEAIRRIWEYVIGFEIRVNPELADAPADWWNVSILPPRAPNVDVGRNSSAESQALADGRTNFDLIYGPQGLSWREELKKLDEQFAFIEANCPALAKKFLAAQPQPQAAPSTANV